MPTWQPSSTTVADWGTIGVIIAGTDVTWYRDKPAQVQQYSLSDPFTDETAVIRIPGLTGFGTQPAWLKRLASVDIYRLNTSDERDKWLWVGQIASVEYDTEGATLHCIGAMAGTLANHVNPQRPFRREEDIGITAPAHLRAINRPFTIADDFGTAIGITSQRRGARAESLLDHMLFLLEQSTNSSGIQRTWLRTEGARRDYTFQLRDITTEDWTVTYGGRGVDVRLARDFTQETTAIYGEGTDEGGRRWRNLKVPNIGPETVPDYPNDDNSGVGLGDSESDVDNPASLVAMLYELYSDAYLTLETFLAAKSTGEVVVTQAIVDAWAEVQRRNGLATSATLNTDTWAAIFADGEGSQNIGAARFDPLYRTTETERFLYAGNGSIVGYNPSYDQTVRPVERFVAFGDGISKAEAARVARREIERVTTNPTYRGTITLTADPEEGHRLDVLPGDNIRLKQFGSNSGVLLHVSGVSVDLQSQDMPVTLAVDNVGTMLPTLLAQFERDRQRAKDPVWRLSKSRTSTSADALIPWDYEAGSGRIPYRSVVGGGWRILRFIGAEAGIINSIRVDTDPAREFAFAIFGKDPGAAWLQANIGNPLDESASRTSPWQDPDLEDALNDREFVEAWGWAGGEQGGLGYGRVTKYDDNGDTRTLKGWFADDGQWQYFCDKPPWLFLAIWTSANTTVWGTLRAQVTEGE